MSVFHGGRRLCGVCYIIFMEDDSKKYTVTYSNGALKKIDELTEYYKFDTKEDTLNFALVVINRLKENGNVRLKDVEV